MLAAIEHKFSVISITETCIRSADCDELNLPVCQFVTIYRNLLKQWENCRYLPLKSPLVFSVNRCCISSTCGWLRVFFPLNSKLLKWSLYRRTTHAWLKLQTNFNTSTFFKIFLKNCIKSFFKVPNWKYDLVLGNTLDWYALVLLD